LDSGKATKTRDTEDNWLQQLQEPLSRSRIWWKWFLLWSDSDQQAEMQLETVAELRKGFWVRREAEGAWIISKLLAPKMGFLNI